MSQLPEFEPGSLEEFLRQTEKYIRAVGEVRGEHGYIGDIPDEKLAGSFGAPIINPEDIQRKKTEEAERKRLEETVSFEEARRILGDDFFGEEEGELVEKRIKLSGVTLTHIAYDTPRLYRADIEAAKMLSERVIVLPVELCFGQGRVAMSFNNIVGIISPIFTGKPIDQDPWFRNHRFATNPQAENTASVLFLPKSPIPGSQAQPASAWGGLLNSYQEKLHSARRKSPFPPSVSELALAELLVHTNTGERLLQSPVVTRTMTADGNPVYYEGFTYPHGFELQWLPADEIHSFAHIYPTR